MSTRLKHKIECVDCGAERLVTKACLNLVSRCKPCQKIFNRDRARNRYREIKGIPLDKPVVGLIKPKAEKAAPVTFPEPVAAEEEPKKVEPAVTPEEQERRRKALERLFEMLGDDSTVDDW